MSDDPLRQLLRGVDRVVPEDDFAERIRSGDKLRVKLGLDPTAPSVTLGWAVVLRKLRQFQDLGHTAVLIVGDFTAQVGDPSGKSETRKRLTAEQVAAFAEPLLDQFRKILAPEPLEIRYNSEWLAPLDMADVLDLTSKVTVAQMLERGDFAKRFETGTPISVMEFMYPLLQAYDSVAVRADVELGGADQLWNLMMGRVIQERSGQRPQVALTMPLLIGIDGHQKMSQSLGNYIGIEDPPAEMFGKTMRIPDELMIEWFRLTTDVPDDEILRLAEGLADGTVHPGDLKRRLAREIVTQYWGDEAAAEAEEEFNRVFRDHRAPDDVPTWPLPSDDPVWLPGLLRDAGLVTSSSEARRLLAQGAVKLDGNKLETDSVPRDELTGRVVQVGKRRFVRFTAEA